ncbi:hypothetical protein ABT095_14710 [Kitasatospora sp. NPDC002227]|uniref:hypothetical protein n=1 Tax=Kitasatospora sp. NPDC002227 TaxID=3154773 RepID=UPI003333DC3B
MRDRVSRRRAARWRADLEQGVVKVPTDLAQRQEYARVLKDFNLYDLLPPDLHDRTDSFLAAVRNCDSVMEAVMEWSVRLGRRPELEPGEFAAPDPDWVARRTGLTEGMVMTAVMAFLVAGLILVPREGVWVLGPREIPTDPREIEALRENFYGALATVLRTGLHSVALDQEP